jgi:purine-binding chemotaxis protein CheW
MAQRQYVTFRIDSHLLGLEITAISEVNRLLAITPIQHAPAYVRGFVNLRGKIVTVFDLAVRLGLPARGLTPASHNIILKNEPVGLLVDAMGEILPVEAEGIEPAPGNTRGLDPRFLEGVVTLPSGLLVTLDVTPLLATDAAEAKNGSRG